MPNCDLSGSERPSARHHQVQRKPYSPRGAICFCHPLDLAIAPLCWEPVASGAIFMMAPRPVAIREFACVQRRPTDRFP
uniref:Uncharacterized protein n=1 Tax=Steinernema glaseri TaxID=37863 RepID=A0A1I7YL06_9BILA